MSNVGFAVFFLDVTNDLAAAFLAEVDVDIWGFESALIQESFKEQVIFDGAYVRQIGCVTNQRTDTATSGRGRHIDFAGIANEVPND